MCRSYGLLGPSGCGKTTLLKCIVGTLKISRGHITVLGKPPAFPGHEVPGKMVGYMPQVLVFFHKRHQSVSFKTRESPAARGTQNKKKNNLFFLFQQVIKFT